MKVSLNWVREYVDLPPELSMEQLAYDLTMRTVEVEGWESTAKALEQIVIGEILSVEPHPDADKLRIVQVQLADREAQIVCGGSNLRPGQKVVVALPGSFVRWHGEGEPVEIKKTKLRGVPSEGMICASAELSMEDLFPSPDEHFIMDLSDFPGAEAGRPLSDVLDYGDQILDIDNKSLTNRPDLWGHYGIARELSAIYGKPLKALPSFDANGASDELSISIENPDDCPRYTLSVWEKVENRPSPFALKLRLHHLGHTPRSLLVDLSNYVMLATGEPNHVFDAQRVKEGIEVRRARQGEELELLDETKLKLSDSDLLICSGGQPAALAGIMGGSDTATQMETESIAFECASFNPLLIRRSSKRYDLHTDAEMRFEKGIDTARVDQALGLMQDLLKRYCPEAVLSFHRDAYPKPPREKKIQVSLSWLENRLGQRLSASEIEERLKGLGFQFETISDSELSVLVPSWRATGDVDEAADILEEVARMIGYENFEFSAPEFQIHQAVSSPRLDLDRRIREYLAFRCGFQEVFTYPWIHERYQKIFHYPDEESLSLSDPPAPEQRFLRRSLLPGLLKTAKENEAFFDDFAIFESSEVFQKNHAQKASDDEEILPHQPLHTAALIFGSDPWQAFRRMKGILEAMPSLTGTGAISFAHRERPVYADPDIYLDILDDGGEKIGELALLSASALEQIGFKRGKVCVMEFSQDALSVLPSRENTYREISQFPSVSMDFSLIFDEGVQWSDIEKEISDRADRLIFLEEYRGRQIPAGKKSVIFRVWFSKKDGTLTSDEIEGKRENLLKRLQRKLQAELRN